MPLSSNPDFDPFVRKLKDKLRKIGVSNRVDASGASIGKRYAVSTPFTLYSQSESNTSQRNDELGTPLGITVDFQSIKDNTFTLRDRDTTGQVRASLEEIAQAVANIVRGEETWSDVAARLPKFEGQEVD